MSDRDRGKLIVFEGIDGVGKTTQATLAFERVRQRCHVKQIREPTKGIFGAQIRLAAALGFRYPAEQEAVLFVMDRREHVDNFIEPSLHHGCSLIMDRYLYSTVAYQGARGLDVQRLLEVHEFAPKPDILFLLDMPPHMAVERLEQRSGGRDVFENDADHQAKIRALFLRLVAPLPWAHVIDASKPKEEVAATINSLLTGLWD